MSLVFLYVSYLSFYYNCLIIMFNNEKKQIDNNLSKSVLTTRLGTIIKMMIFFN